MINVRDLELKADRIAQEQRQEEKAHCISYLESIQEKIEEEMLELMFKSNTWYNLSNLTKDLKSRGYREDVISEVFKEFFVGTSHDVLENGDKVVKLYR